MFDVYIAGAWYDGFMYSSSIMVPPHLVFMQLVCTALFVVTE